MLVMPQLTMTDKQRFWSKIQRTDHCWLWTGAMNTQDRKAPMLSIEGSMYYAARIAWLLATNTDPGELFVLHNCKPLPDNYLCMNPSHLWLGTNSDNQKDAFEKGQKLAPSKYNRQFSPTNIEEIRRLRIEGWTLEKLASKFGSHFSTIGRIVNYEIYQDC